MAGDEQEPGRAFRGRHHGGDGGGRSQRETQWPMAESMEGGAKAESGARPTLVELGEVETQVGPRR